MTSNEYRDWVKTQPKEDQPLLIAAEDNWQTWILDVPGLHRSNIRFMIELRNAQKKLREISEQRGPG